MRHSYSVLAIARRHPQLFNKLVKAVKEMPALLQDDNRELSRWLSNRLDARQRVRENAKEMQS